MAQITFTIPDDQLARIRDAFAGIYNYQPKLADGTTNPENKNEFMKRMIRVYAKEVVKTFEAQQAVETARTTALQWAESTFTIS